MKGKSIPLSVPCLRGNERKYMLECLDTEWVSYLGPFVDRFEGALATYCGAEAAVATASGTAALHIALLVAGVQPDTEVVVPAVSFVAPANAVRYCGAWPTFVDVSASDWQLDVAKLEDFLARECERLPGGLRHRATGRTVSAILPVHLLGGMCDVDAVVGLAARYGLSVVEDGAQALGALYRGRGLGAPEQPRNDALRLATTSFNGNKIITTGGGGAILANDSRLATEARHLSTTAKVSAYGFYHDRVGYNYRLTNCAAAMGLAQLEQLPGFVVRKHEIAARYAAAFRGDARITLHAASPHTDGTHWVYTILLEAPSRPYIERLNSWGIEARPLWEPLPNLPAFRGCTTFACDFTRKLAVRAISLPSSVGLSPDDQAVVIESVLRTLNES